MLRNPLRPLIFDMDGLLIDTEAVYIEAYARGGQRHRPDMPLDLCHAMIGVPTRECEAMIQDHSRPGLQRRGSFAAHFSEQRKADARCRMSGEAGSRPSCWISSPAAACRSPSPPRRGPTTCERHLGRAGLLGHFKRDRHALRRRASPSRIPTSISRRRGGWAWRPNAASPSRIPMSASPPPMPPARMAIMVPDILPPCPKCARSA